MTNLELFIQEFTEKANEIQKLLEKYGLEEEVSMALGISHTDWDIDEPKVQIAFTSNAPNLDDFDDLLAFIQTATEAKAEEEGPEEGTIDWWIDRFGDGTLNWNESNT